LKIGAAVKVNTIEHSEIISKHFPILNQIAYRFGTFQVRSMGTIGGNICNASPAADFASVLLALDAQFVIYSPEKTRVIPISEFFINTGETALLNKEFLGEILIPPQTPTSDVAILRHSTREMLDVSVLSVCIWMDFDEKLCQSVRIGLGSVAPTPVRANSAEQVLIGKPLTDDVIQSCINCAQNDVEPISDFRSSAQYRRAMMAEYIRRILTNWS